MTATVQTLLGFDVGEKRIGVAVGQALTATASPLITIAVTNNRPDWTRITQLIQDWQPQALVVGIPLTMADARQPMTGRAEKFMRQLQGRYKLPTYGIDERLSSYEAQNRLRSSYDVDPAAAQIILETWLADNVPGQ